MIAPISLGREEIRSLLDELARRLAAKDCTAIIYVVGGAAIALELDSRRSTHDIDAVFEPATTVRAEADVMAQEHGLAPDWLNDAVRAFVPPRSETIHPAVLEQRGGVSIVIAPLEHLLAMKMAAFRASDMADLRTLFSALRIDNASAAADLCRRVYGEDTVVLPTRGELIWQAQVILESAESP